MCNQPVFHYPRYIPVGRIISIEAKTPSGVNLDSAKIDDTDLPILKTGENEYIIKTTVRKSGLQKINFKFSNNKETYILFEGMHNIRELMEKRAEFILKYVNSL